MSWFKKEKKQAFIQRDSELDCAIVRKISNLKAENKFLKSQLDLRSLKTY
nr:hypothetical protein [Oenococcus oeni]